MTKLTLQEWDELIGRHLHMIEAGAEICERHAQHLFGVPDWPTRAADQMARVESTLGVALTRICKARQEMERKPRVG
ncbi:MULTISPECIES: hypothetical protein [unclassified Bradyrhizobium]|uniref:hypothetical protein n=1 Tax=unclassified Bradyrhizobium TaxID=2631580 RepID=UPI002FF129CD